MFQDYSSNIKEVRDFLLLQKYRIHGYLLNMEMNGKICDLNSNFHKNIHNSLNIQWNSLSK